MKIQSFMKAVIALALVAGCQKVEKIDIAPPTVLFTAAGQSSSLTATALDADGKPVDKVEIKFASSDDSIATVDAAGKVTAVKSGAATVSAKSGEKEGLSKIEVRIPAKIVVTPTPVALVGLGATVALEAKVSDQIDRPIEGAAVNFAVADQAIAMVTDRTLTSKGVGTTKITASFGAVTQEFDVTVTMPEFATVAVDPAELSVKLGESGVVNANAKAADGNPVAGVSFTFASSDEKVATVDASGKVSPVAAGAVTITATAGDKSAVAKVKISK